MLFEIVKETYLRMYDALALLPDSRINFLYILTIFVLFSILMTILLAVHNKIRFFS